jgi:hypothetical protein
MPVKTPLLRGENQEVPMHPRSFFNLIPIFFETGRYIEHYLSAPKYKGDDSWSTRLW